MDLFDKDEDREQTPPTGPLADRMRPRSLTEVIGQEHLLGAKKIIERSIKSGSIPSLILWGPPGSGKTTLGRIIAKSTGADFVTFSAVLSGVKDVREVIKRAKEVQRMGRQRKTILFVDEIHRFNKAQQDAFLHHVEDGTITLIGATTENPSFEINAPLLSRCKVLVLNKLKAEDILKILKSALDDTERGLGEMRASLPDDIMAMISSSADGDARWALNTLESAVSMTEPDKKGVRIVTKERAEEAMQKKALLYDKGAEEHYNIISAFIKSMRGSDPDAAVYWLARMVEAGEDPLFIARRMVIFASEDIGNADPRALSVALGVKDSVHFVGMPEGFIPLAQGTAYLATAPKSNSSYRAYKEAKKDIEKTGTLPVPLHIRNAPTKLMKELDYGKGYQYPHDHEGGYVKEEYLPEELRGKRYYRPSDRGYEQIIRKLIKEREEKD